MAIHWRREVVNDLLEFIVIIPLFLLFSKESYDPRGVRLRLQRKMARSQQDLDIS